VIVKAVAEKSAAEQAGILAGDFLLTLDGEKLTEVFDLTYALRSRRPGDSVLLTVLRNEQEMKIEVRFPESADQNP
jgi:serine protease Do